MASWSKVKQQLESFLCPDLKGRIEYRVSSYRYAHDRVGRCCIVVDKQEIFQMNSEKYGIRWYQNEQEIVKDEMFRVYVTEEEIDLFLENAQNANIPRERVPQIISKRKKSDVAKAIMDAQVVMSKSDFQKVANTFITSPIEECLNGKDILLNVLAIMDRRVGKNRLRKMEQHMRLKHPIVQYFYELRCNGKPLLS